MEYYGINPQSVIVEINEAEIDLTENLINFVNRYLEFGLNIAIDDFGTSHSNIDRLIYLDFKFLKLARVLIHDANKFDKKIKMLEVMKFLSEKLNVKLIAEGIETIEESELLATLDIQYQRGYNYCKPMLNPLTAMETAEIRLKEKIERNIDF